MTINLAPANIRKEGAGFDLPMALGILGAMGTVAHSDEHLLVGELSLDGTLRPVRGALLIAVCARRQGIQNLLVPVRANLQLRQGQAVAAPPVLSGAFFLTLEFCAVPLLPIRAII